MTMNAACAVIFDCDGVVVDSETIGLATLELVVNKYGLPLRRPELDYFCGHSDAATHVDLVKHYGEFCTREQFLQDLDEAYSAAVEQSGVRAFPGLPALLRQLQAAGIPYGIGSSSQQRKLRTTLGAAGLTGCFPVIVGSDDVAQAKPAPDIFLEVARRLQTDPSCCVVIEDSPTGIQAASNAQMACVGVTTSFPAPALQNADLVVAGLEQLDIAVLKRVVRHRQQRKLQSATSAG